MRKPGVDLGGFLRSRFEGTEAGLALPIVRDQSPAVRHAPALSQAGIHRGGLVMHLVGRRLKPERGSAAGVSLTIPVRAHDCTCRRRADMQDLTRIDAGDITPATHA